MPLLNAEHKRYHDKNHHKQETNDATGLSAGLIVTAGGAGVSPQRPRQPALPPVAHAKDALLAIIVPILASRIAQDGGEKPEEGSGPGSDGDAERGKGRQGVHHHKHGRAILGGCGARIDEVQLQVERRGEEGGDLGGESAPRREEADGLQEEGDQQGEEGPEGDEEGEEGAGAGEEELRLLALISQ